ncbi:unnamed protein product [Paramecium primaurelia]|uniref:EF-hand domain-containing protein n=1 Tax=Paramecium primaurelia TaxID=5886 RepID=A0A8S1LRV0_PARPR|nr:unnamed protein product [Paramecium primaurelia]
MDWRNKLELIQNKIRGQLHARKIDDLEGVYQLMAEFDKDNSGYLDKDEFQKFLSKIGVFLTTQELRAVYDKYDSNKDGNIAYAEFVNLIRENMSERRINVVRSTFAFLDQQRQGRLLLENLYRLYQAKNHPRVRTRQKTADQVTKEFVNAISKRSKDGQSISEDEFLNYYADCNATLPSEKEEYFTDLLTSTWGVTSGADYVSPERLAQLEIILFEKIRQKTVTKDDEGKTAKKAFMYFDLENKGTIDIYQFAQALQKFGCVFSDKEIQALFNKYDADKSGRLCYDEICGLIALMGSGNNANVNPVFQIARAPPQETLNRIRQDLVKKGQHSVIRMATIFANSDKNKNGTLNRQEFQWAMKESGFLLTKTEYDNLFRYFDKNCDDEVSFVEFISFLRKPLTQNRADLVCQLWNKISNGQPSISIQQLKQCYDASKSQDVSLGIKTVADSTKDFNDIWKDVQAVTQQQFIDYLTDISALIESEAAFEKFIRNSWR